PLAQVVLGLVAGVDQADELVDQLVLAAELLLDPREGALGGRHETGSLEGRVFTSKTRAGKPFFACGQPAQRSMKPRIQMRLISSASSRGVSVVVSMAAVYGTPARWKRSVMLPSWQTMKPSWSERTSLPGSWPESTMLLRRTGTRAPERASI